MSQSNVITFGFSCRRLSWFLRKVYQEFNISLGDKIREPTVPCCFDSFSTALGPDALPVFRFFVTIST